ncbi:TadE/TadG family type IV pilus assembly protein [Pontivivens ytuae]|uniref:Pilus assembly protein n=1 Tax=Pontivivens ytuae TaxID=2789856 RepID=A0A7S9QEK7_9RHOB|nr:TadE/TadG family type IV pilus assembly protein [Pontivivens ytuae]QPH55296.1 pilus assembly protein [Pontivivens ytuae]
MLKTPFDRLRTFLGDARGAITVEFVVTLPILLAALGFAEQYGNAMRVRNSMDVAARDAARFISRAPINENTRTVDDQFICTARQIITLRLAGRVTLSDGSGDGRSAAGCTGLYTDDSTGELSTGLDGEFLSDSILILPSETETIVAIVAAVEFPFVNLIGFREKDVSFSVTAGGAARIDYIDLVVRDIPEGIAMTAIETWPRTD